MELIGRRPEAGGSGPIRLRRRSRGSAPLLRLAPVVLLALSWLTAARGVAGFFDRLQHLCDADFPECGTPVPGIDGVYAVAPSPGGMHLYACSALDDTLTTFARDAMTGALALVDQEIDNVGGVDGLDSCRGVAVSPDGKSVYAAALLDRAVSWFDRNAMTGALTFNDRISGGSGSGLSGANAVAVSPDDRHVYVASRSDDAIVAYTRNTTTGDLTFLASYFDGAAGVDGLDAVEAVALSPDGKHVYAAAENDNAVAVFARNTNSASGDFGKLTFLQVLKDGVAGVDGLAKAGNLALDPVGANLYVGSERTSGGGDWIAVFVRNTDPASGNFGKLTYLESFKEEDFSIYDGCFGVGPQSSGVAVSPDGLFAFFTNPFRSTVAAFSRSSLNGSLGLAAWTCDQTVDDGLIGARYLAPSADGKHLYSVSLAASSIVALDVACNSPNVDLVLSGQSSSTVQSWTACRSITLGPDYQILAAGEVTLTAPGVAFVDDVEIDGMLTVASAIP